MKKIFFFAVMTAIGLLAANAQTPTGSLNIKKVVIPANLTIDDVQIIDPTNNNTINADEDFIIRLTVKNSGRGAGYGLKGKISASGDTKGLICKCTSIPKTIQPGASATVEYTVSSNKSIQDGRVTLSLQVDEINGYGTESVQYTLNTQKFQTPKLVVSQYAFKNINSSLPIESVRCKVPFNLQVMVKNEGGGMAEDVNASLKLPPNVDIEGSSDYSFSQLGPGEYRVINYTLIVRQSYAAEDADFVVRLAEKQHQYAENKTVRIAIEKTTSSSILSPIADNRPVSAPNLAPVIVSDVDINIPRGRSSSNRNRFALIIGNENYADASRSIDVTPHPNVPYAASDAISFKNYCQKTLGIDPKNIIFYTNASEKTMHQAVNKLLYYANIQPEDKELIIYYAGHGIPIDNSPYMIPVDVALNEVDRYGISLDWLYDTVNAIGVKRATVFVDACFSGGGRDGGFITANGARAAGIEFRPKEEALKGNLVVFAASSPKQTAGPYKKQLHGMFTYFLLKKLQENPNCTYDELGQYLIEEVGYYSMIENGEGQNPSVRIPRTLGDKWKKWTLTY